MTYRDCVESVLGNPKYSEFFKLKDRLAEDIKRRFFEWLENLFRKIDIDVRFAPDEAGAYPNILTIIAIVAGLVVVTVAIICIVYYVKRRRRPVTKDILAQLEGNEITVSDLVEGSDKYAREGDLRSAVRYRFIALLWIMHKSGYMSVAPSATEKLIVRDIKKQRPERAEVFTDIIALLQLAWYGRREVTDTQYNAWLACFNDMFREVSGFAAAVNQKS